MMGWMGKLIVGAGLTDQTREYNNLVKPAPTTLKPASQARGSSASCRQTFAVPLDVPRIW